jgi:hypothetical protein
MYRKSVAVEGIKTVIAPPPIPLFLENFKKKNLYCRMKAQTNYCPLYQGYKGMLPNQSVFLFVA